jgi:hypothetical protein
MNDDLALTLAKDEPKVSKPKYLITNCVYGPVYSQLFLEQHLKSVLDETNLPDLAETYDIEYMILTDTETTPLLQSHPNMQRLTDVIGKVSIFNFEWGNVQDRFGQRYNALLDLFKISVKKALQDDVHLLTCWVADLVVAKEFFAKILKPMEEGHDAVFVLPLRSAAEPMIEKLDEWEGALPALKLCKYGYENLHPLWWACHWENPLFTKLPFTLLWNNGRGLKAHSYSVTPVIFKPRASMLADDRRGMIDGDIPELCENPYWATDWIDAPVIGVEPLFCYYPTFENRPSSVALLREWQHCLHPSQVAFLKKPLYYPSKQVVGDIDVRAIPDQITMGFSSVVEHRPVKPTVGGSNPPGPAIIDEGVSFNRADRRLLAKQQKRNSNGRS